MFYCIFSLHADCIACSWRHSYCSIECIHCSCLQAQWDLRELLCWGWLMALPSFWETWIGSSLITETREVTGEYSAHRCDLSKCMSIYELVWALAYGCSSLSPEKPKLKFKLIAESGKLNQTVIAVFWCVKIGTKFRNNFLVPCDLHENLIPHRWKMRALTESSRFR